MAEYNNAAGRILDVFERFSVKNGQTRSLAEIAEAFGVESDWQSVFTAYCDLQAEYELLESEIDQIKENDAKHALYRKNLPDIKKSIKSFSFDVKDDKGNCSISQIGLVAMRFIAADLVQDEPAELEDIARLRALVDELQSEIETSTDFTKEMKEWLLDLVRVIRDSLDRYAIRGSKGMRRQFATLIGELKQNFDFAEQTRDTTPSIWSKIISAIDIMNKIASLAERCRPALRLGKTILPLLGLPGPENSEN